MELSKSLNFDLQAYSIEAALEQTRPPRLVRIGAIQHSIVLPTTAPVIKQREAIFEKVGQLIYAASLMRCNIVCLQEAWNMPFAFCTREKAPWNEFAEAAYDGPSTLFLKDVGLHVELWCVNNNK